ncbi:MAG: TonB-dependent receptor [Chitinophagales bacterium]|nr:TonB-dependent receptor [Chitinophagales bacterium]MDW8419783.1 TonB-dependent receptor [Chitinophagales bacterium]
MKQHLCVWLTVCGFICANGQTLNLRDYVTRLPIEGALIKSHKPAATAITNARGQADIAQFRGADSIFIRHLRYEAVYSFAALEALNFTLDLQERTLGLGEVVVSANRWEQKKLETPNRVEVIQMREAAFQNPQTSADLLGMSGYAFIQKSQLGGGSPMLRGMATNRVLLVVDGVRMNTAIFRSGNLQNVISLDANAMEGVEILFGPGSVMYGSDAVGGVMSFQTLQPRFSGAANYKPLLTGNGMARFSSANMESTGHIDCNIGMKNIAILTSLTYANYNDLRSGSRGGDPHFYRPHYVITIDNKDYMVPNPDSTLQVGSKYSQWNFMQKVRYSPSENLDMEYAYHFSQTSPYNRYDRLYVMRYDGPYKEKLRWAEWYYGPQKWQMHRLGVNYDRKNPAFDHLRAVAAYQFFEESRNDREFMYRELMTQRERVYAFSLNLDFIKQVSPKLHLNYGTEAVFNYIRSVAWLTHVITKKVEPTVTRYPDKSTWQSYGVYLNTRYQVHRRVTLSGGLRYNHFLIDARFDTTYFPFPFLTANMRTGSLIGSAGVVYAPFNSWQLYANFSNGFRAPNVDDMGKVFESVPGYLVVPNPGLKPEKVYNAEIGTVKTFGNYLRLDASLYYTWLMDAMARKNFTFNGDTTIRYLGNKSRIQAIQNVTRIHVYGVQAGVEFFFKGFGIRSNISYQHGREQEPDSLVYYPLRHAAPTFGSTHLTYEHRKFKVDLYGVYNLKMDWDDLALTERVNPSYARDSLGRAYVAGWFTLNCKAGFYPSQYFNITAGVENIFDKMYRPYASGINAPGRNFIVSLRSRF